MDKDVIQLSASTILAGMLANPNERTPASELILYAVDFAKKIAVEIGYDTPMNQPPASGEGE